MTARLALALSLIALLLAGLTIRHEGASVLRVEAHAAAATPAVGTGYSLLDNTAIQRRLWGLPCVSSVIESAYSFESNLIDNAVPVADQDDETCGTPGYRVHLPGHSWDHYGYSGTVFVQGSGWVLKLITPTGGHLSLLHLEQVTFGTTGAVAVDYQGEVPPGVEDATGLAVGGISTAPTLPAALILHGGEVVGISGYPTDPIYGNGLAGSANSQLCQLTDITAQNWLLRLAEGRDLPRPTKPFPAKRWSTFTRTHHARAVPYRRHGKLRPIARFWTHHQSLGGVKHEQTWHPKYRTETMPFQHGVITYHVKANHYTMRRTA